MVDNSFDSNSLTGGNFFAKILLFIQIELLNTNFPFSICKNIDATNKKTYYYYRIYKMQWWMDSNFQMNFLLVNFYFSFGLVAIQSKKIRAADVKNTIKKFILFQFRLK
jgi:hypothetical protein